MLCYVMLCYVMLCYVMLCYVMLRYVMLYYIIRLLDMSELSVWVEFINQLILGFQLRVHVLPSFSRSSTTLP